jgi:hypothetical protein
MGKIKGQKEYMKFKEGSRLTRKEAMLAMCYQCNGFEDSREDCRGANCPMYEYAPYHGKKKAKEPKEALELVQASFVA